MSLFGFSTDVQMSLRESALILTALMSRREFFWVFDTLLWPLIFSTNKMKFQSAPGLLANGYKQKVISELRQLDKGFQNDNEEHARNTLEDRSSRSGAAAGKRQPFFYQTRRQSPGRGDDGQVCQPG